MSYSKKNLPRYSLLAILSLLIVFSCDSLNQKPISYTNPEITFRSGGTWVSTTSLKVSANKKAILESTYPSLEMELTDEEYSRIVDSFFGFSIVEKDPKSICVDATSYRISISENGNKEERGFESCYLGDSSTAKTEVKELLLNIVLSLNQLADSIYQVKAPWRGLEAKFSLNKEVFSKGEPIEAEYTVHNPTDKVRELWFEHSYPYYFRANPFNFDGDNFYYVYPNRALTREDDPTKITLAPGEAVTNTFIWDQTFENNGGEQVPISEYMIRLSVINTDIPAYGKVIRIVD